MKPPNAPWPVADGIAFPETEEQWHAFLDAHGLPRTLTPVAVWDLSRPAAPGPPVGVWFVTKGPSQCS